MEAGTNPINMEKIMLFRHFKIFGKLKKRSKLEINLKNGNVFITGKN